MYFIMDYEDYLAGEAGAKFWFRAKNNLIDILMVRISKFYKKKRLKILNIGAGTGYELKILNKYGDNYVTDINKDALNLIDQNLYVEKRAVDACNLPFKDNFFDIVVCLDVLEHIQNDHKVAIEIYRVLGKKGKLVFTVPAFQILFGNHDLALNHIRRYNKKKIERLLKRFKNLRLYYWNFILFLPIAYMRLIKRNFKPKVERIKYFKFLDNFFYLILKIENLCIKYDIPLPFGLSIVGFCEK